MNSVPSFGIRAFDAPLPKENIISPTLHSPLSLRISRAQLHILIADLEPLMLQARGNATDRRVFKKVFPWLLPPAPVTKMSYAGHKHLIDLWDRLRELSSGPQQSRYRLTLDVFEAALCSSALRAARRTKGDPVLRSTVLNLGKAKQRRAELLSRMENYRRQLQRRFKAELDNPARAAKLQAGFDRYRKTLVRELLRRIPIVPTNFARMERELFETLVTSAQEGLNEAGSEIPPARELRRLVSGWLRRVRNFRAGIGMRELFSDPSIGKGPLTTFIQTRLEEMRPRTDLATRQAAITDILRRVLHEVP